MKGIMIIRKNYNNSLGYGLNIWVETPNGYYPERFYYGYSKRDAERKYREEFNLKGRRMEDRYDWT